MSELREFHLFAGIGGGIYGSQLLGHKCCGGVEIDKYCQTVLKQRQADGWMNEFPIYDDITTLDGSQFINTFDILSGGFPCQAFSHAAHGKNIAEKNLWSEMLRFIIESDAPVVFGENVTLKALTKAKSDLENIGYSVHLCRLSCGEIGGDHRRDRFWLLGVKHISVFEKVANHIINLPKLSTHRWALSPRELEYPSGTGQRRKQLKAIGNAQSPFAAATAFRILVNRHINGGKYTEIASQDEILAVIDIKKTWIKSTYGEEFGYVHTPTTMANYSCPSMMKHQGCRNYLTIFGKPTPKDAEYLMGFPLGASLDTPVDIKFRELWQQLRKG